MAKKANSQTVSNPPPSSAPTPPSSTPMKSKTSGAAKKKKKAAQLRQEKAFGPGLGSNGQMRADAGMIGAYPDEEVLGGREADDDPTMFASPVPPNTLSSAPMHGAQPAMPASLAAATRQTQEDFLATATDLYRQIETAAAAALAGHLHTSSLPTFGPVPPAPHGHGVQNQPSNPDDDTYWTSLPSHLRSFIRSALPLAAGLTPNSNSAVSTTSMPNLSSFAHAAGVVGGPPGSGPGQVPQLSSEQMAAAAEQLARVVQSHDWGRAVTTAAQQAAAARGGTLESQTTTTTRDGATLSVSSGTLTGTIPLGSFTLPLPLHPHPDHPSAQGGDVGYYGGEAGDDVYDDDYLSEEGRQMVLANSIEAEPGAGKKKNKKKKKKNMSTPVPQAPLPQPPSQTPLAVAPTAKLKSSPAMQAVRDRIAQSKPAAVAQSRPAPTPVPTAKIPGLPTKNGISKPSTPHPNVQPKAFPSTEINMPKKMVAGPSSERERIRDFWLTLDQEERAALVKVEKDAVLRKMKEQQRHGCSCAVCGRKRSAIEQELEVLYDAYYDELEDYAEAQREHEKSGGRLPPPPGPGPFPGSVDVATIPPTTAPPSLSKKVAPKPVNDHKTLKSKSFPLRKPAPVPPKMNNHSVTDHHDPHHKHSPNCPHHHHDGDHVHAARGKGLAAVTVESVDGDEDDEDEEDYDDEDDDDYDEDEDDEGEYDDDDDDDIPALEEVNDVGKKVPVNGAIKSIHKPAPTPSGDFFGFGNSLTVKGGILTVADDLLRNDGQKFLEMMESLADKRIQRERQAAESLIGHPDQEYEDDDYDDDDEEDDDEEDVDDDDLDDEVISEEQRMEEGRRMFQIFAARMFEQRVLTAYREKVAQEKQAQLLRELEDEDRLAQEKEMKKVKDAQKKKEKKKAQKQQKDEDSAKRAAEKEAEEAAIKAADDARLDAERRRQDEQRLKREAQKKAQDEERVRREEEKRKRQDEESRKRKEKEEKVKLDREVRLAKEKDERERKAREEADRKAKLDAERKERDAKDARAKEVLKKAKDEADKREAEETAKRESAKQAAALARAAAMARVSAAAPAVSATPKVHQPQHRSPTSSRSGLSSQASPMSMSTVHNASTTQPSASSSSLPAQPPRQIMTRPVSVSISRPPDSPVGAVNATLATAPATPATASAAPPTYTSISPRPPSTQIHSTQIPHVTPVSSIHTSLRTPHSAIGAVGSSPFSPPLSHNGPSILSPLGTRGFPTAPGSHRPAVSPNGPPPMMPSQLPIGPPGPKSPNTGHAAGPLSSLHDDSQPFGAIHFGSDSVRKVSASAIGPIGSAAHIRRRSGATESAFGRHGLLNGIGPIGVPVGSRKGNVSGEDETPSTSESASPSTRSSTGPAMGSSALLNDDDALVEPHRRVPFGVATQGAGLPPSGGASFFASSPFDSIGLGSGGSIWGSPAKHDGGWGAPSPPSRVTMPTPHHTQLPPQPQPTDWLRLKAVSAYINMRLGDQWIPVGDVSVEMQRIYPETRVVVDLKDMVNAILMKPNVVNGGGDWQFNQIGPVLYTRWVGQAQDDTSMLHQQGQPIMAIGTRR